MSNIEIDELQKAKAKLDHIITISRTDLYKPIQVAEALYQSRMGNAELDFDNLETYKNKSLQWRNQVSRRLIGKISHF